MLNGKQRQVARALARRRFEAAAELDEAETLQIEPELAPEGWLDEWPVWLMFAQVLVVAIGAGYIASYGG